MDEAQAEFVRQRQAWRAIPHAEQVAILTANAAGVEPATLFDAQRFKEIRLLILGCDYRGEPALECGCTNTRICLMGKGKSMPGTFTTDVTNRDCEKCVKGER